MKIIKRLLLKALIWAIVTVILVILDNELLLSESYSWFPFVGIFLPVICAIFFPIRKKNTQQSDTMNQNTREKNIDKIAKEIDLISDDVEKHIHQLDDPAVSESLSEHSSQQNLNIKGDMKLLGTDLLESSDVSACCPKCAMYRRRIYSLSGSDTRFPPIPTDFDSDCCGLNLYPYILGVSEPTFSCDDPIKYSNRPFVDDRTDVERQNYQKLCSKGVVQKGSQNYVFSPIQASVPQIFTEKEYALNLIDSAKEYAGKINNSTSVFDFVVAYKMIKQTLEKLAWFNEEKHIFMYPTPRNDFFKMYNNMENTINDFIFRSMGRIKKSGGEWESELSDLFDEMEKDSCFSSLMTDSNREQIQQIRSQLENASLDEPVVTPTRSIQRNSEVQIDYVQILKDEAEWRRQQRGQTPVEAELARIDKMDGHTFERWCARLLEASGFKDVEVTRKSGDQGVDVLATLDGVRYAVQCKCYASDLGNKPVQEVYAGIAIYKCQLGSVMTNRRFTSGAKELAAATQIALWDRDWITSLLEELEDGALPL